MAKAKEKFQYLADGSLDSAAWINKMKSNHELLDVTVLNTACELTKKLTQGLTTFYGQPCIELGLEVAETILNLKLDQETAAASIICGAMTTSPATQEMIKKELGNTVAKLIASVQQMDIIPAIQKQQQTRNQVQIDKMRKMLLAMATDIRVVIIKLAERLCFMRGIKSIQPDERKRYAQEVLDIYAPLANRLGIGQLKWELEDLAFHYLDPHSYKTIASFLAERRVDREKHIQDLVSRLREKLDNSHIQAEITGRAKHIYSIYLKTKRKELNYKDIYDCSAVRILVPTVEDCYTVLSIVNSLWPPIMEEFDDYIANPKPNGYRSIHSAVIGDDGKHFEIQIRTKSMHEEAERGVAAHWLYKENTTNPLDDTTKITYLRQLLDWHKEIAPDTSSEITHSALTNDQIYVVTPAGDILDLPQGATPIDFAYCIHSELGHRCRGAKINGQIVPLTYKLQTGDKVEIITVLQGNPSRDWLNPELGYVKTSRAKSKISHWFKQQAFNQDVAEGRQILERELARNGLSKTTSLSTIARSFNLKDEDALLVSLGRGSVRIGQILHALHPKSQEKTASPLPPPITKSVSEESRGCAIVGASDLLTRFAKCCKPIPGDAIIGYITHGRGISIHKKNCTNAKNLADPRRFIQISWDAKKAGVFNTDLKIITQDQHEILNDITALFANEKISLLSFNTTFDKNQDKIFILVTVQIQNTEQLHKLLHRIQQLPGIIEVMRMK